MNKFKVISVIVDTRRMTLYLEDGSNITMEQGDPRFENILNEATDQILKHGIAEIEIGSLDNVYTQFEKKSNGLVRFFKVMKNEVKKLFGASSDKKDQIREVMKNAVHSSSPEFSEESDSTTVAEVDGNLIPGVEKIKHQFGAKHGTKGMENFLKRLGPVMEQRSHTVQELLTFLEKGDLPIADDGSIVAYKVLRRHEDRYVDCYTGKVQQRIGSFVCMDERLIDPDRTHECSTGLHVARRGYVGGFPGDVCTIIKIAPEDVIAVPPYDANKMRVKGYHIVAEIPEDGFQMLKNDQPMTGTSKGKNLLGNVLAGNHPDIIERVEITKPMGGEFTVSPVAGFKDRLPSKNLSADAIDTNKDAEAKADPVDPKKVVKKVTSMTRKEKAKKMYDAYRNATGPERDILLGQLNAFKRSTRQSWKALGLPDLGLAPKAPARPSKAKAANQAPTPSLGTPVAQKAATKLSNKEQVKVLLADVMFVRDDQIRKEAANKIMEIKKRSRKSWESLGVSPTYVAIIKKWM